MTKNAFQEARKTDSFRAVSPKDSDPDHDYAVRTSLFYFIDGEKICIRTDAKKEKTKGVENAIQDIKGDIRHLLVTGNEELDSSGLLRHLIPTNFEKNVFESVLTVVFNCEDKEAGKVIKAVLNDAEKVLENNHLEIGKKTSLNELYYDLTDLKKKLDYTNDRISLIKQKIKDKKEFINHMNSIKTIEKHDFDSENNKLILLEKSEEDLSNIRIKILQEVLIKLIQITKLLENHKYSQRFNDNLDDIGRLSLITNGGEGSVGFIEAYNHNIFFTNTILEINEYEVKFFDILKKLSKGNIDLNITDQTGCGDSSTAAALMIREKQGRIDREKIYFSILEQLKIPKVDFIEAISIAESYFLSTFQKVISGVVYHCKKSNLGDIPNSHKIANIILGYVFRNTIDFMNNGGLAKFLYGDPNSSRETRKYNGFNIYKKEKNKS